MNTENSKSEDLWLPCGEGAIVNASASIRDRETQKTRRQFLRAATQATAVVAGLGFAGWTLFGEGGNDLRALRNNPNYPGGIACSEVQRLLTQYIDDSLNDADLKSSIDVHLAKCGHCCEIRDTMIEGGEVA